METICLLKCSTIPLPASAIAAHAVSFEVREHDHGIVVEEMLADHELLQVKAARDRQRGVALFIHDVDGRKGPAVRLQDFPVSGRRLAGT